MSETETWGLCGGALAAALACWRWMIGTKRLQSDSGLADSINSHISAMMQAMREELETKSRHLNDSLEANARMAASLSEAQRERDEALRDLSQLSVRVTALQMQIQHLQELVEYHVRLIEHVVTHYHPSPDAPAPPVPPSSLFAAGTALATALKKID